MDSVFSEIFSEEVEKAIREKCLTKTQLAEAVGLSASRVNKLLNHGDTERWTFGAACATANHLNISLDAVAQKARVRGKVDESRKKLAEQFLTAAKESEKPLTKASRLYHAVSHELKSRRDREAFRSLHDALNQDHAVLFTSGDRGVLDILARSLALFFDVPWQQPRTSLDADSRAFLLHWAGSVLRAQGRLADAAAAMSAGFSISELGLKSATASAGKPQVGANLSQGAIMGCVNLSTLHLFTGDLGTAAGWATRGDRIAGQHQEDALGAVCRTIHAYLTKLLGRDTEGTRVMPQSAPIRDLGTVDGRFKFVARLQQFFADQLSILNCNYKDVLGRLGHLTLGEVEPEIVLDHLSFGMAKSMSAGADTNTSQSEPIAWLTGVVDELNRLGHRHHSPHALLARAEAYRRQGSYGPAAEDIEHALAIAIADEMKVFHVDGLIAEARLELAQNHHTSARRVLESADLHLRDWNIDYGWGRDQIVALGKRLG